MIRSNLAVLLAEKRLTTTKVAAETGISRTTLTALSKGRAVGVQLDTLNRLCGYLRVFPSDIIAYVPIDLELIGIRLNDEIPVTENQSTITYEEIFTVRYLDRLTSGGFDFFLRAAVSADTKTSEDNIRYVTATIKLSLELNDGQTIAGLRHIFSKIPRAFIPLIEKEFSSAHAAISIPIRQHFEKEPENSNDGMGFLKHCYVFYWPGELRFGNG